MIALVFALEFEARYFQKFPNNSNKWVCIVNTTGLRVAEEVEKIISKNNIQCVVLMGFAGGLDESLCVGDVILAENFTSPEFLRHFKTTSGGYSFARLLTVERVLENCDQKSRFRQESHADCCDMESAHVWKLAERLSIPMLTLRSISDAWDTNMPVPGDILIDPQSSRPKPLRILAHLLRHPQRIPDLIRMLAQASTAGKRLAAVAQQRIIPDIQMLLNQKED